MSEHLYKMNYRLVPRPEGITNEEAKRLREEEDLGSCDAVVIASIIRNPDGSSSTAIYSSDGDAGGAEMDAGEMFKVWSLMAHQLSKDPTLGEGRRNFCGQVFEVIRQAVLAAPGPDK